MADDAPSSLVLFLISIALLGSFVGLLWAINVIKTRVIMSRTLAVPMDDSATDAVHAPVSSTSIDHHISAPASSDTDNVKADTDGANAGTGAWELPRISRYLSDRDIIVALAAQRTRAGKYRLSANQIARLIGGSRADVLALVKTIREGPTEFRPLSPEQQTARGMLGLPERKRS